MNKAEELIACLEGEIAKRDETITRLEPQLNRAIQANYDLRAELAAIKAQEPVAEVKHGPLDISGWPEFVRVETIGDFDLENLPNGMKLYAAPVSEAKAQGVVMPRDIEKSFLEWASAQLQAPTQLASYMAGADEVARLNAAPAAPAADADHVFYGMDGNHP